MSTKLRSCESNDRLVFLADALTLTAIVIYDDDVNDGADLSPILAVIKSQELRRDNSAITISNTRTHTHAQQEL